MMVSQKTTKYIMFFIPFALYYILAYMQYTTIIKLNGVESVISYGKASAYVLAVIVWSVNHITRKKIQLKYLFLMILFITFFTFMAIVFNRKGLFIALLMSLNYEEKYSRCFYKDYLKLSVLMLACTVFLSMVNIIENVQGDRIKFGITMSSYALGFNYHAQLLMMVLPIMFIFYYRLESEIKWYHNFFWILILMLMFAISKTVMGTFLGMLYIILRNISVNIRKSLVNRLLRKKWIVYIPFLFCMLTIVFLLLHRKGNVIGIIIDLLSNGRYNLGNTMIDIYGIELFGTSFENNNIQFYQFLDSEYMHMFVGEGIIYTVLSLLIGTFIMKNAYDRKDMNLTLIWIMVFFNAMFNNGIFNLIMNPFCISIASSIRNVLSKNDRFNNKFQRCSYYG